MTSAKTERNAAMFADRRAGLTFREIAAKHGVATERVFKVVNREARRYLDELEMRLLANTKTDDIELFVVPNHAGDDFDAAIDFFQWTVSQLAERGVELRIHYRAVENGVAFGVEDVTPYGARGGDKDK